MTLLVAPLTPMRPMTGQDHVLGENALGQYAGQVDAQGRRAFKRAAALEDADFQVGGAHAGGKGAEGPVGAGVRIAHDHGVAGPHETLLRKKSMADPVGADVEKILDFMASGPSPQDFALHGGFGILGRRNVVDDHLDARRIEHPVFAALLKIHDGRGGW